MESAVAPSTPGWGKKAEAEEELSQTLLPVQDDDVLELDELWSFVQSKANQAWLWLILCRRTRQTLSYALGDRSAQTCKVLWKRLPAEYQNQHCYSDFWEAYQSVIPEGLHEAVGKESGQTNHIERMNCTLRQRLGCLVRKTLSFSKSMFWHEIRIRLFLLRYNRDKRASYEKQEADRLSATPS